LRYPCGWVSGRVLLTLLAAAVAGFIVSKLNIYYSFAPWTRDGHVRADVVQIAPDVSGLVTEMPVHDNERVIKGQLLFEIDRERYALALGDAIATANQRRVELAKVKRESIRNSALGKSGVYRDQRARPDPGQSSATTA
jgi:multidrug resistance efflux pump